MLVLKINYTVHLDRSVKSVRYHAFRSRETPDERKGVFSRDKDHADVGRFIDSLDDPLTRDRTTRSGRQIRPAKLHRLMFSLSRKEFQSCGFTSWKSVIREAMEAVERQHGFRLEWVAAEHQSAEHPHVHVDVKSVYTAADGTRHRLIIKDQLRRDLRKSVETIMNREKARVREERRQERELNRALHSIADGILKTLKAIGREDARETDNLPAARRRRREAERDNNRDR